MNALSKAAKDAVGFSMQGNVSVGPDGSIRVKKSFYGQDKDMQNRINNQLAKAHEEALRQIGKKPINIIGSDFSEKVRKILGLDSEVKNKSKNSKSDKTKNRGQGGRPGTPKTPPPPNQFNIVPSK